MPKRFLVDADGVLFDFITPALEVASRVSGRKVVELDMPTWDLFDLVGRAREAECHAEWSQPGWCAGLKPYPGAQKALARLQTMGDVYVVTALVAWSPHWVYERTTALQQHFQVNPSRVIFTTSKHVCEGDYLLEDHPGNIQEWEAHHPNGRGLLFDHPYNRRANVGTRVTWTDLWCHLGQD